jgi:hypothetical protein
MVRRNASISNSLAAALDHAGAVHQCVEARAGRDDRGDLGVTGHVEPGVADGGVGRRRRDLLFRQTGGEYV